MNFAYPSIVMVLVYSQRIRNGHRLYKQPEVGQLDYTLLPKLGSILAAISDARSCTHLVSYPDPPPKRKGGSGKCSTASHHGLAIAMDSSKSYASPLKLFAAWVQQIGGVLSRSVKV